MVNIAAFIFLMVPSALVVIFLVAVYSFIHSCSPSSKILYYLNIIFSGWFFRNFVGAFDSHSFRYLFTMLIFFTCLYSVCFSRKKRKKYIYLRCYWPFLVLYFINFWNSFTVASSIICLLRSRESLLQVGSFPLNSRYESQIEFLRIHTNAFLQVIAIIAFRKVPPDVT